MQSFFNHTLGILSQKYDGIFAENVLKWKKILSYFLIEASIGSRVVFQIHKLDTSNICRNILSTQYATEPKLVICPSLII